MEKRGEFEEQVEGMHGSVERDKAIIAYFSMEIGINSKIPTYSGGLGILAGDTIKSFADLSIPSVAVTLLYRKGYFYQRVHDDGRQEELPYRWEPEEYLQLLPESVTVQIEGRRVTVRAWRRLVTGISEFNVPVIFLDTDVEGNSEYDRSLSHHLYGGDERYRLCQEAILGIGGVRMLAALGFSNINRYHMNEGHASLLTLELLNRYKREREPFWDIEGVRLRCVFTTHTPVEAGHDKFSYDLVHRVLDEFVPYDLLKQFGGREKLNMTLLALNLSHYVNGVAKEHGKVSREMFPGYNIESITNGIHSHTWVGESFQQLYSRYIPGWANDPFSLRYALSIPCDEIWKAHMDAKKSLIDFINNSTDTRMDYDTLTIGIARRATAYKRTDLILFDTERLVNLAKRAGKVQLIFSGKAHPKDTVGKDLIREIAETQRKISGAEVRIVYLQNYDMELARMLVSGTDLWLNTPRKPKEASGTSGMKAAHNGVPSLSILDGWWIEGCLEGITGWAIGSAADRENIDSKDADSLYDKLEHLILPMFYHARQQWVEVMRNAIAINGSFFNTHRMVQQYVLNAYLY